MDLIEDYLSHAVKLAAPRETSNTEQVDFRRAVSAAYYAVFHLLTVTAAESWSVVGDRHRFARLFDHGRIKNASNALPNKLQKQLGDAPSPADSKTADALKSIAKDFVALQDARHIADYDNARVWSYIEVEDIILRAHDLCLNWAIVGKTPLAESYLLDMLGGK